MATGVIVVAGVQAARLSLAVADANLALTADQARCRHLEFTAGAIDSDRDVTIPAAIDGMEWVVNNTTGYNLAFKVLGGSGVTVANNKTLFLRCNATDVVKAYDP